MKNPQLELFAKSHLAHGGELRKRRRGRGARPLSTRCTMHFVLRSSKARGPLSFLKPENSRKVHAALEKFTRKNGVLLLKCVNVGNHLHLHLRFGNRHLYRPFIRGLTAALAHAIAGKSKGFWDQRPFSRVVKGRQGLRTLGRYLRINVLESWGFSRSDARFFVDKPGFA